MQFPNLSQSQTAAPDVPYSAVRPILNWVYIWLCFGLAVTAVVAMVTASNAALLRLITSSSVLVIVLAQLGITVAMTWAINRLSQGMMTALYFVYTGLTGFTFSILFLAYSGAVIGSAFITTAGVFAIMSFIGFTTQMDLTRFGGIALMAVIGLLIAMLVNLFINNDGLGLIINIAGVLIFTGIAAYKTQLIKRLAYMAAAQNDEQFKAKISVYGAFSLYLTFINLFLFILRLMGGRRR